MGSSGALAPFTHRLGKPPSLWSCTLRKLILSLRIFIPKALKHLDIVDNHCELDMSHQTVLIVSEHVLTVL